MKKGQIIEGIVTKVNFPNKGIVESDGERIEVKGVLPGQKISVAVQKVRHGKAEGRCLSVLEHAPYEIGALCPHSSVCGGCSYQTMPYEEQLKLKEQQVLALMQPIFEKQERMECSRRNAAESVEKKGGDSLFEGIRKSPRQFGYRNKMEFTFGDEYKDGPLSLGMHKKGSFYDIVPVTECRIVDEDYRKILRTVMDFARENEIPFYHRMRHEGYLRHLLVRKAARTGELLIAIVTTTQEECLSEGGSPDGKASMVQGKDAEARKEFLEAGRTVREQREASQKKNADTEQKEFWEAERTVREQWKLSQEENAVTGQKEFWEAEGDIKGQGELPKMGTDVEEQKGLSERRAYTEALQELCERLLALPLDGKIVGIVHTSNDSLADIVQNDATEVLFGQDYFYEELLGLRFRISEFSFFQTNSLGAEVLYETAREYIGEIHTKSGRKPVIYDLYSGTGTIAQMMAPVAERVIGVEIVEEAVRAARENAESNDLHSCEFIAGDVLKVLDEIKEQPDFIVLDPPRDGIHPKALKKIIAYGVERLVYISCKPTSLVRDLETFLDMGYRVERMCCVDMFPGTVHVETVCLLSRKPQ